MGERNAEFSEARPQDKVHIYREFELQKYKFATTEQKKCAPFFTLYNSTHKEQKRAEDFSKSPYSKEQSTQ